MISNSIVKIVNSVKRSIKKNKRLLLLELKNFHSNFITLESNSEIFSEFYNYCQFVTVVSEFLGKYGEYTSEEVESILTDFIEAKQKYFVSVGSIVDSSSLNLSYEKYEQKIRKLLS